MYCDRCGREIEDGSLFCEHCGASLGGEDSASGPEAATPVPQGPPQNASSPEQRPVPPPPAYPAPPGGGMGSAPQPAVPPAGKSKAVPVLVALCALLLAGVVVLVLMLTVFKGGGGKEEGEGASADPVSVTESYLKALEEHDLGSLIDLLDPAFVEDLKDEYGRDYRDILEGYFLEDLPEDLRFYGLELTQEIGGDRAEVSLKKGKASYRGEDGKKVEVDLEDAVTDTQKLVRVGGKWYIDMKSFEDWEDFLADYVKGGRQGGGDKDSGKAMKSYENVQIGIAFDYPEGWAVNEYPEGFVEAVPSGAESEAKVTFSAEDLSDVVYTLDDWIATQVGELEGQGWPYEVTMTTLAGVPAAQIVFSYLGEQSYGYKVMDTIMIAGDNAYSISYIAREEVFEKYLGATRKMTSSFKLLSGY